MLLERGRPAKRRAAHTPLNRYRVRLAADNCFAARHIPDPTIELATERASGNAYGDKSVAYERSRQVARRASATER